MTVRDALVGGLGSLYRIPMKGGAEMDVFSRWRKIMCYTSRPGVCKRVKRGYNKRVRRAAKMELRDAV